MPSPVNRAGVAWRSKVGEASARLHALVHREVLSAAAEDHREHALLARALDEEVHHGLAGLRGQLLLLVVGLVLEGVGHHALHDVRRDRLAVRVQVDVVGHVGLRRARRRRAHRRARRGGFPLPRRRHRRRKLARQPAARQLVCAGAAAAAPRTARTDVVQVISGVRTCFRKCCSLGDHTHLRSRAALKFRNARIFNITVFLAARKSIVHKY